MSTQIFRKDFQRLTLVRIAESKTLFDCGHYSGAYYLGGLSIECALKACIAKLTQKFEFPDQTRAKNAFSHSLEGLLKLSQLESSMKAAMSANITLATNWSTVKDWKVESRYEVISAQAAHDLYQAASARRNGVLTWIKKHW